MHRTLRENKTSLKSCLIIIIVNFLMTTPSYAHEEGINLSATVGPGIEVTTTGESLIVYGAAASYLFPNAFEIGIEFEMTGAIPTFGIDVNHYFTNPLWSKTRAFVGIQTGLDFDSPNVTEYIGPQFGFDYPLEPKITIGPEIQYLYTIHDRGGIFEILVNFKYFI